MALTSINTAVRFIVDGSDALSYPDIYPLCALRGRGLLASWCTREDTTVIADRGVRAVRAWSSDPPEGSNPSATRAKHPSWWRHLLYGLRYGYPPCCVARWVATHCLDPDGRQGVARGVRLPGPYIPCGILHPSHMTHAQWNAIPRHVRRMIRRPRPAWHASFTGPDHA